MTASFKIGTKTIQIAVAFVTTSNVTNISINCSVDYASAMLIGNAAGSSAPGITQVNLSQGYANGATSPLIASASSGTTALAYSSDKNMVYEVTDSTVRSLRVETPASGGLASSTSAPLFMPSSTNAIAVDPLGRVVHVASRDTNLLTSFLLQAMGQ